MKNIIIIFLLFLEYNCMAQTPVKSLYEDDPEVAGAYYKDLYNNMNNFVGTWKYTNGTTSLTITLQKKEMQFFDAGYISYYEDLLVGEYKYIEDGVEKINTLPELFVDYNNNWNHNIVGNLIIGPNSPYCLNCGINDRKVLLGFKDPTRDIFGMTPQIILKREDDGYVQKIKMVFSMRGARMKRIGETEVSPYTGYTVPFGEYILVKQ